MTRLGGLRSARFIGGALLALGAAGRAWAWAGGPAALGADDRRVEIGIRYSAYSRDEVTVRTGEPLTIVLHNADPIAHEWLVGDAAFHERHRQGTETVHGARPNEVSLPPGTTVTTTVTFRRAGEYLFICHLPGHEAYGMVGVVRVVEAS